MLRFPQHGHMDSVIAAWVVVEHESFQRPGVDLAVFTQAHCGPVETVRLSPATQGPVKTPCDEREAERYKRRERDNGQRNCQFDIQIIDSP